MIHDIVATANPFPYTAKFVLVGVRNKKKKKLNKSLKDKYNTYKVLSNIRNIKLGWEK